MSCLHDALAVERSQVVRGLGLLSPCLLGEVEVGQEVVPCLVHDVERALLLLVVREELGNRSRFHNSYLSRSHLLFSNEPHC